MPKFVFDLLELLFLGHLVNADCVHPPPEKVEVVRSYPKSNTTRELHQFFGVINFYKNCMLDGDQIHKRSSTDFMSATKKKFKFL